MGHRPPGVCAPTSTAPTTCSASWSGPLKTSTQSIRPKTGWRSETHRSVTGRPRMSASERLVHEHPALVAGDGALVERVDDRVCEQDVVGELGLESVDQEVLCEPLHRRRHIGTTANQPGPLP